MTTRITMLTATIVFLFLTSTTGATVRLVPSEHPNIAAGLFSALHGDTVQVAAGTYFEHDLVLPNGVTLRGATGQFEDVVIDAQQMGRILFCEYLDSFTLVENLTLTGGLADGDYSDGIGGGALCAHSSMVFRKCAFVGNSAMVGGGLSLRYDADVRVEDCLFLENAAVSSGGGVRIYDSAPTVLRCRFIGNTVEMDGGGLFSGSSALRLEDCLFLGNEAYIWGGALLLISPNEGDLLVRGCTFVDNTVVYSGSAIFAANECPFTLENCLVTDNHGAEALYVHDDPAFEAITCCNVYGNDGGNYGGNLADQTGINGNISLSPGFCDPAEMDFHLAANSPCLPDQNECGVLMGAYGAGCGFAEVPPSIGPGVFLTAHPNPFNPVTTLSFKVPRSGPVAVKVYDLRGQEVVKVFQGRVEGGRTYRVDFRGEGLASGTYFTRLTAEGFSATEKMQLVK